MNNLKKNIWFDNKELSPTTWQEKDGVFVNAGALTENGLAFVHARTCVRAKTMFPQSRLIPEWPLLSAPWRSQMPVTSPWRDKSEGEPDTDSPSPQTERQADWEV